MGELNPQFQIVLLTAVIVAVVASPGYDDEPQDGYYPTVEQTSSLTGSSTGSDYNDPNNQPEERPVGETTNDAHTQGGYYPSVDEQTSSFTGSSAGSTSDPNYQPEGIPEGEPTNDGHTQKPTHIDPSKIKPSDVLGKKFMWDGNNDDFDLIQFDDDDKDLNDPKQKLVFEDNGITPEKWIPLLKNYLKVLSEIKPQNGKIENKITKAEDLMRLEQILFDRHELEFKDGEEEQYPCAKMEYNVLSHVRTLPADKQAYIFDLDHDGIRDVFI